MIMADFFRPNLFTIACAVLLLLKGDVALPGTTAQGITGSMTTCPDRFVAFRGSCYLFGHENAVSFIEAEHYCGQHGGHLVHVDNAAENAFLTDFAKHLNQQFWLGVTDETAEGVWEYYDTKAALTFSAWYPGAPDDWHGVEDCAVMSNWQDHNYRWDDVGCNGHQQPLCEIRGTLPSLRTLVS